MAPSSFGGSLFQWHCFCALLYFSSLSVSRTPPPPPQITMKHGFLFWGRLKEAEERAEVAEQQLTTLQTEIRVAKEASIAFPFVWCRHPFPYRGVVVCQLFPQIGGLLLFRYFVCHPTVVELLWRWFIVTLQRTCARQCGRRLCRSHRRSEGRAQYMGFVLERKHMVCCVSNQTRSLSASVLFQRLRIEF